MLRRHLAERRLIGLDVADVAFDEQGTGLFSDRLGRGLVDIDEAHLRALGCEMFNDRRADARAAARDEDAAILEARVGSK